MGRRVGVCIRLGSSALIQREGASTIKGLSVQRGVRCSWRSLAGPSRFGGHRALGAPWVECALRRVQASRKRYIGFLYSFYFLPFKSVEKFGKSAPNEVRLRYPKHFHCRPQARTVSLSYCCLHLGAAPSRWLRPYTWSPAPAQFIPWGGGGGLGAGLGLQCLRRWLLRLCRCCRWHSSSTPPSHTSPPTATATPRVDAHTYTAKQKHQRDPIQPRTAPDLGTIYLLCVGV